MSEPDLTRDFLPAGAPRLGLGCADLFAGDQEPASRRLLWTAYDCGVRYFDVARLYGNGQAEGVVGRAFRGLRDQVVIASKAGILPWSMLTGARIGRKALTTAQRLAPAAARLLPEPPAAVHRCGAFGRGDLQRSVETSLRALGTDYLDILLLHECELSDAVSAGTLSLLEELRAAGKVRAFGVATGVGQTRAILAAAPDRFAAAQFPSDLFSRNERRLPAAWRGLTITHSILKGGLDRLREHVTAEPARAAEWRRRFARPAEDAGGYAELLLQDALASHAGLVLFATSRPERIAAAVEAALKPDAARAAQFREYLEKTGLRAAA